MRVFDYCAPLGGRWRRIILLVSLREHSGYYVSEMIAEICRCGGATHASHGWPWKATQGLRGAGTAQRNAAAGASLVRQAPSHRLTCTRAVASRVAVALRSHGEGLVWMQRTHSCTVRPA